MSSLVPEPTPRTRRSMLMGSRPPVTTLAVATVAKTPMTVSDMGRKRFGYSHEELEDCNAYYEGNFQLNQRGGFGQLCFLDTGAKYLGNFQADKFHGQGDNTWADGSRYVGQWRNGQKHGQGTFTTPDGLTYEGQWEHGRRHGLGSQQYANGDSYRGGWFRGLQSGRGTYTFADGSRFEGTWAEGRHDGLGLLYSNGGSRERHVYKNGFLVKREVLADGAAPEPGSRRDIFDRKVVLGQERADMIRATQLPAGAPSPRLIRRETHGLDLSVPPLKPKTAPAGLAALEDVRQGLPLPSTAPADTRR